MDTNVVIWLLLGDRKALTADALAALEEPGHELIVTAASVWEIAIKRSIGKLDIEASWAEALFRLDLVHLPVTAAHARVVETLPWHHRDPFDRLLISQAIAEQCSVVTADDQWARYEVPIVW